MRRLLPVLLLAALPGGSLAESDEAQVKAQLAQLQRQITLLNNELSSVKSQRETLLRELQQAEVALGRLAQQARATRQSIADIEQELIGLESQKGELEAKGEAQRERIAAELVTAWKMGRQQQLKVLLNQEQPHTVARAMSYYRYFFDARQTLIEGYRQNLAELNTVQQQIEHSRQALTEREAELIEQSKALQGRQTERQQAAERLAANIAAKGDELKQLQKNQRELEQLLETIENAVVDIKLPEGFEAFAEGRGKMPWPVGGKPSNRFGHKRNAAGMRWQGVNIPARAGTTVSAIHQGRVVYADWFRGSGLLLIIDHGDGYMSLYAHNQSLLREVGEWVKAGTPISTVGDNGSLDQSGVYFEIRHQGKPVDPARWCRS